MFKHDGWFNFYLRLLLGVFLFCLLSFPKVYISQQIYLLSRDISKLQREYDTLKEEKRLIEMKIEVKHFKIQVLDTLF